MLLLPFIPVVALVLQNIFAVSVVAVLETHSSLDTLALIKLYVLVLVKYVTDEHGHKRPARSNRHRAPGERPSFSVHIVLL